MYYFPLYSQHLCPPVANQCSFYLYLPDYSSYSNHPYQTVTPPLSKVDSLQDSNCSTSNNILELPKKLVVSREKKQICKTNKMENEQRQSFIEKRNIIPNNINHILSFVQRKNKSLAIVEKTINKFKGSANSYTAKRFYAYQIFIKGKLSIHVNKSTLDTLVHHLDHNTSIFPLEQQIFYNTICRSIIHHYLSTVAPLVTLHSRRLIQTNKNDHLRAQRNLIRYLQKIVRSLSFQQTSF